MTLNGINIDSNKTGAARILGVPTSVTEVHSFLDLCTHYRRFGKHFSKLAAQLTDLTKKKVEF